MGNTKKNLDAFFRWVWRITGLLLLLLVLYGAASVVGDLVRVKDHREAPEGAATIGRPDRPDQNQPALKLGRFEALEGTSMLYAQLGGAGETMGLSSSYVTNDIHNLLFFDTATRQARWLLDDNARTIAALSVVGGVDPMRAQGKERAPQALGLLFLTRAAKKDDKGDARWDMRLASVDGRQIKILANGVDTLLDHQLTDNHTLLVFYAWRGVIHVIDVDPATREIRSDRALPAHN